MLSRFPKIIGAVIATLLLLAWLYQDNSSHSVAYTAEPLAVPSQQSSTKVLPDRVDYAALPAEEDEGDSTKTGEHVSVPTGYPVFGRKSPYGYVFYATSDEHACSALISMGRLKDFHTKNKLFALITENVAPEYKEAMEKMGVTVSIEKPMAHPKPNRKNSGTNTAEKGLMKLAAFRMHQMDRSLKRVVVVDADTFIYQSIDALFGLPDVDLAAPRAYWDSRGGLSTGLMVISLSDRVWKDVQAAVEELQMGEYDWHVVNRLFNETALTIPGQYFATDKHWVDWTIPKWFRPEGSVHSGSLLDAYSKASLDDLWRIINLNIGGKEPTAGPKEKVIVDGYISKDELNQKKQVLAKREEPKKEEDLDMGELLTDEQVKEEHDENWKAPEVQLNPDGSVNATAPDTEPSPQELERAKLKETAPKPPQVKVETPAPAKPPPPPKPAMGPGSQPFTPDTHPNRQTLYALHDRTLILHLGSPVKPWEKHVELIHKGFPDLHPAHYEHFRHWRENARKFCPSVRKKKVKEEGKEGEDEYEFFHFVNAV